MAGYFLCGSFSLIAFLRRLGAFATLLVANNSLAFYDLDVFLWQPPNHKANRIIRFLIHSAHNRAFMLLQKTIKLKAVPKGKCSWFWGYLEALPSKPVICDAER